MALLRLEFINYATEIKAPVEEVFNFFKEVEKWPSWASGIKRAYCKSTGQWQEGFRLVMVPHFLPLTMELPLVSYEEGKTIAWGFTSSMATIVHAINFEPVDSSSCRVIHSEFAEGIFAITFRPLKNQDIQLPG